MLTKVLFLGHVVMSVSFLGLSDVIIRWSNSKTERVKVVGAI